MTARESRLAAVLLVFIVVAAFGFFGYQFYWSPLRAKEAQIANLRGEIDERLEKIGKVVANRPRQEKMRKVSLPADVDFARRTYGEEIYRTLKDAGFEAGSITVVPKPPETRTSPSFANKKPIYTKLLFTVHAKGDLASLVDWMERFYKLRLLHQIRNFSVQVPVASDRRGGNDLDVTMTLEALVLDNAEARKTLVPEKSPELQPNLAQPERQYASIAGRNLFFGPSPPAPRGDPTVDVTPFVKLDSITHNAAGPVVTLFDSYHNHDYRIAPKSVGGYRVEVSYYIKDRKRGLRSGSNLELHDDKGDVERLWQVIKITDRELILRDDENFYGLHVGQTLAEMKPLKKREEVTASGIKEEAAETAAAPEKGQK